MVAKAAPETGTESVPSTEIPSESMSVWLATSLVMGEVRAVGKDSRNQQQGFMFRGIDAIINAVGPLLRKYGLIVRPVHSEILAYESYVTKSGTNMIGCRVSVTYRWTGPGGDWFETQVVGESSDAGDKSVPKAMSVAWRVMWLQTLSIPTDDPDPDSTAHERGGSEPVPPPPPDFSVEEVQAVLTALRAVSGLESDKRVVAVHEIITGLENKRILDAVVEVKGDRMTVKKVADAVSTGAL